MDSERRGFIEQEKTNKPNILNDFEGCLKAVIAVEAAIGIKVDANQERSLEENMLGALRVLEAELKEIPSDEAERQNFAKRKLTGFHGLHGFNRYRVRGDGSVALLQSHSTELCIEKAQELGIDTPEI